MDPRFKKIGFRSPDQAKEAKSIIINEIQMLSGTETVTNDEKGYQSTVCSSTSLAYLKNTKEESLLWGQFDREVSEIPTLVKSAANDINKEIDQYLGEPNQPRSCKIFQWWEENSKKYPNLYRISKKYLIIQGTSVPSERAFSLAGEIICQKRIV